MTLFSKVSSSYPLLSSWLKKKSALSPFQSGIEAWKKFGAVASEPKKAKADKPKTALPAKATSVPQGPQKVAPSVIMEALKHKVQKV